ncbi:predicted protein [Histoplasma capsulatum H143]|uniref:Uncharacterized protein n=1 Tax=Ajellomyces capsulatus (strain H143) TaxID=544712 RepID=C6HS80_AJECH|nr:predicted protein [Histoplasma capsulatum H143]
MRMSQSRPSGIPPTRLVVPKSLSPLDLAQEWIPRWRLETHGKTWKWRRYEYLLVFRRRMRTIHHFSMESSMIDFVVSGAACSELRHEGMNRLIKTNSIQHYRSLLYRVTDGSGDPCPGI